jgi:hypothetical protein
MRAGAVNVLQVYTSWREMAGIMPARCSVARDYGAFIDRAYDVMVALSLHCAWRLPSWCLGADASHT